ncbi:MAG: HAD family hydrolase, partial [Actinomycetota bacterium]|nr:HAD family hydrolase [Actinomycetota bacterium]
MTAPTTLPPSSPPRLVATDLDGTLLRSDGSASARTVRAIQGIQQAGVEVVVATARPPRWMHDLVEVVGDHGVAICSNGAFVYDVVNRRVLSEQTLVEQVLIELVSRLREAIPGIGFAVESSAGYGREPAYVDLLRTPANAPVADIEDLLDPLPGKLLARAPELEPREFLHRVVDVVGEQAIVHISGTGGLAEISAAGVTKAASLVEWCARLDIAASDVWAFGDMPNDVPMLDWAGVSFAV